MITPFKPSPTSFVMTLKGFMFIGKNDPQTETEVARIIDNAMFLSSRTIFGPFYSVYFIHFLTIQIQFHHSHSFQEEHKRFDSMDV